MTITSTANVAWPFGARASIAILIGALTILSGCTTQSTLTAKSTGCRTASVDILDSEYKRLGITTQWCARCNDKTYYCVGNADKSRVECRPSDENDKCK